MTPRIVHLSDVKQDAAHVAPLVRIDGTDERARFLVLQACPRKLRPCTLNLESISFVESFRRIRSCARGGFLVLRFRKALQYRPKVRNTRMLPLSQPPPPIFKALLESALIFTHAFPPETCHGTRRNRSDEAPCLRECLPAEPARSVGHKRGTEKLAAAPLLSA